MGVPGSNPGGPIIFEGKLKGPNLIQPEAKKDWARGGCSGANIPAARYFSEGKLKGATAMKPAS
jgi:hypothetical protein